MLCKIVQKCIAQLKVYPTLCHPSPNLFQIKISMLIHEINFQQCMQKINPDFIDHKQWTIL